jgi:type IV secretory pathway VirB4 component
MNNEIRFGKTLDGEDVTVPLEKLRGKHCLFRGKTGSGKSLLLANVLAQLTTQRDAMVSVIDLGGDLFMFNYLKDTCEKNGKKFRFFSLDEADATESFDPFQSCETLGGNPSRIANFIVGALSLCYPEGYGSSFYTRLNHSTIANAVQRILDAGLPLTVETLKTELSLMSREPRRQKEASEALFALDQLANYPQLLPNGGSA